MESGFYKLMNDHKQQILSAWQQAAIRFDDDQSIVRKQQGRFSDPINYVITENTGEILEQLMKQDNGLELVKPLETIIKLKATQQCRPSEALEFVFVLKKIIREAMKEEGSYWEAELREMDQRIDEMGMLAFDIYSECRAKICELRVNEIIRMYGRDAG